MSKSLVEEAVYAAESDSAWIRISCPWCGSDNPSKRNMSVSAESSFFRCHKCGEEGFYRPYNPTIDNLKVRPHEAPVLVVEEEKKPSLPWHFKPLYHKPKMQEDQFYWDYVVNRKVHPDTIVAHNMGYCVGGFYANSIIIPMWSEGELTGFAAKSLTDGQYRYPKGFRREHVFFNMDRLYDQEPIVIVEGSFDALPYDPHTVATLGKPTHNHIKLLVDSSEYVLQSFLTRKRVYLMLDGDARSENWAASRLLRKYGVDAKLTRTPSGLDPNDLTEDEFFNLLDEAAQ